jgi:2-dehydro-3-deoxyphosphogluconate aldolase/(4S)-4-hydroxy-2-oxoglutarate aldolase
VFKDNKDMARFDKISVLNKIAQAPMVPVFYHSDAATACSVVKACYDGGVRAFEFTNRGDFAHEVFAQVVKYAAAECPDMAVGVGSVVDPATASLFIQNGACFVVGPMFNPAVAAVCNRRGVPYTPGCGTVTEVGNAQEAGCDLCKVFPGDVLGPKFVKGLMAPMPWSRLMVTGGVEPTEENLTAWFSAGVFCVGMGSKLFPKDRVAAGDWQYITEKCEYSLKIISDIRK